MTWMGRLGEHYRQLRRRYPEDDLVIVFDIDGTIIDTRHLVRKVLLDYDRDTETEHFRQLAIEDIDVHENTVEPLLERWGLAENERNRVLGYYNARVWSPEATLAAHQPYRGVMEVVRWFQLQPRTTVALNTGRPEHLRAPTLGALATVGDAYRVSFDDDLLLMSPRPQGIGVARGKVEALTELERRGLRVVAVIDNEPENLEAMADADDTGEILFLHASTIFLSSIRPVPRTVSGTHYDLDGLIEPSDLSEHVQLVSSEVIDRTSLDEALAEPVRWLGSPLRADAYGRVEVGTHGEDDGPEARLVLDRLALDRVLDRVLGLDRGIRLDLTGPDLIDQVLAATARHRCPGHDLWISGRLEHLGEDGIRRIRAVHPTATISCPVDFLGPLVLTAEDPARDTLMLLQSWGVTRFSIRWVQPEIRRLLAVLSSWGCELDIYDLPDRTSLLEAAVLLPTSVTSPALRSSFEPSDRAPQTHRTPQSQGT
jgi:phosphoglycolate phosphatase-like HAD superfamily hydrolase